MSAPEFPTNHQVFTVLVADDSLPERHLIAAMFHKRGHRVMESANGAEALLAMADERPDVVVSDGRMPILDGYQFCRLIKDEPLTRDIPVILLTGQAEGLSRFWARTCGADLFLLKGRDTNRVVDAALELLANRPSSSSPMGGGVHLDYQKLRINALHQRLGKALERRLLESSMRDTIGHLDTLHGDPIGIAANVLELLHELVLPGAIHLALQGETGPLGIGLHGALVSPAERAVIEDSARKIFTRQGSWPSTWKERPPLQAEVTALYDPGIFSLWVETPGNLHSACLTLYMEQGAFHDYERLFEVACLELGRLLDLVRSHRQLLQAEAALRQAQKMESLALMAGGIAHDFNNLFQSIMGNLQVAERCPSDERGKLALARVMTAVQKGAALGRRMLETSGKIGCVTSPVNLNAIVREVVSSRPFAFALYLAEDLPPVPGDPAHLKQVLVHLVDNAMEAIGSGSGCITISTCLCECVDREESHEGRWFTELPIGRTVAITLADSGCGITEDVLRRMFDPFFSTKQFGRGLSLAASLGILKAHRASLCVESHVGEGTTFQIWLPLE